MTKKCFECKENATEEHHVIPISLGGTQTIPLCGKCHALVHGGYNKRRDDHIELTLEGLRKAKERGTILGNRTNLKEAQTKGAAAQARRADEFALSLKDVVVPLKEQGMTLKEISDYLTSNGFLSARGGAWDNSTLCNLFKRLERLKEPQKELAEAI